MPTTYTGRVAVNTSYKSDRKGYKAYLLDSLGRNITDYLWNKIVINYWLVIETTYSPRTPI